ncbi:MAG: hypothetical protein ACNA8W_08795, partial [Bradymonadaceae bacterium]
MACAGLSCQPGEGGDGTVFGDFAADIGDQLDATQENEPTYQIIPTDKHKHTSGQSHSSLHRATGNQPIDPRSVPYLAPHLQDDEAISPKPLNHPLFPFTPQSNDDSGSTVLAATSCLSEADCTMVVYSGYIGGMNWEYTHAVTVDSAGAAYVSGNTQSTELENFPVQVGPSLTHGGGADLFVGKVRADGTGMVYLGYIGGSGWEDSWSSSEVGVDGTGAFYVSGHTGSGADTFPLVVGPYSAWGGTQTSGAFVAKVSPDGTNLAYSGYMPGTSYENNVTVDDAGYAYLATDSSSGVAANFPVTVGPNLEFTASYDIAISKINPDGSGLIYAGFIGGNSTEYAYGVGIDNAGAAYVSGLTYSSTFPAVVGPYLTYKNSDAVIAKIAPDGTNLVYSGFVGGTSYEWVSAMTVHRRTGTAVITGETSSTATSFPVQVGPILTYSGSTDAMVGKVRFDGMGMMFLSYLGGESWESGYGVATDERGAVYLSGATRSMAETFPHLNGPSSTQSSTRSTCFVAKITPSGTDLVYSGFLFANEFWYDDCYSGAVDSTGAFYVGGYTYIDPTSSWVTKVGPYLDPSTVAYDTGIIVKLSPFDGCTANADCDDGTSCTDNVCGTDGICSNPPNGTCNCVENGECDDGDECTTNVCALDGACYNIPTGLCCNVAGDCRGGDRCTDTACVDGFCAYPENGLCCSTDAGCDDGSTCTENYCGQGWIQTATTGPTGRYYHAMASDSARQRLVIHGGLPSAGAANTWEWNGASWIDRGTVGPGARYYHAMAYDEARGRTVLFGGYSTVTSSYNNEVWEWDGTTWFNVTPNPYVGPGGRYYHSMAYDEARGRTVLFGGYISGVGYGNDTWEWNGTAWTQVASTGPTPRYGAAMAFDRGSNRTVLYGGFSSLGYVGDTWEWNGTAWTQVTVTGVGFRHQAKMVYDRERNLMVLIGGYNGSGYPMEVAQYDGETWTTVPDPLSGERYGHAAGYDFVQNKVMVFGGYWSGYLADTLHFHGLKDTCQARPTNDCCMINAD